MAQTPNTVQSQPDDIFSQVKGLIGLGGAQNTAQQSARTALNTQATLNNRLSQGNIQPGYRQPTAQPSDTVVNSTIQNSANVGQPGMAGFKPFVPTAQAAQSQPTGTPLGTPPAGGTDNAHSAPASPPTTSTPPDTTAANTYSGGVNGYGQKLAGYGQSFPGLVSSLAGMSAGPTQGFTQGQQTAENAATALMGSTPQQSQAVQDATNNLKALQDEYAKQTSIVGNSPIGLSEQGGEQGLINQQYTSKLANAQTALQNALQGNAQIQSAYTGAGNVANTAASVATGQQGTQQQGLGQATGYAQPRPGEPYGYYHPLTNQTTGYNASGGNAAEAGGVGAQMTQGAQIQQMTGQQSQAQALAKNLSSLLQQGGINFTFPGVGQSFASGITQWIDKQSGDPKYQNYANLINEISSRYASILNQSGGTPTDQSTLSHQIINGLANGQDLQTVLQSLDKNATDSINALKGAAGNNANGTTNTNTFGGFFTKQ